MYAFIRHCTMAMAMATGDDTTDVLLFHVLTCTMSLAASPWKDYSGYMQIDLCLIFNGALVQRHQEAIKIIQRDTSNTL